MHLEHLNRQPEAGIADAAYLLALVLWDEAAEESVRVQEALAAVVANQVRQWRQQAIAEGWLPPGDDLGAARLFVHYLSGQRRRTGAFPPPEDAVFATCRRIAGRAISGALRDPTAGAVRFHRLGFTPPWVSQFEPGPLIGSHLFYYATGTGAVAVQPGRSVA